MSKKKLEKIHARVTQGGVFVGNCPILPISIMTVLALNMIYLKIQNQFYGNHILHWTETGVQMACWQSIYAPWTKKSWKFFITGQKMVGAWQAPPRLSHGIQTPPLLGLRPIKNIHHKITSRGSFHTSLVIIISLLILSELFKVRGHIEPQSF